MLTQYSVKSYIVTDTMWMPDFAEGVPRYRAVADSIARDVAAGRLKPGDRLPTHRELADALSVTVGTITRGFAEAERRGLTTGEVGRGTFVRGASPNPWPESAPEEAQVVDLSLSLPVSLPQEGEWLGQTLRTIAEDTRTAGGLLTYCPETGSEHQRSVAADWLGKIGLRTSAEELLVTAGSQHALNLVLAAVFRPGQVLLTPELTYPSLKSQARIYGVRLRGVALDEEGVCPDAVERACRQEPRPTGLYLTPTIHNPTSASLSPERRQAIADIAAGHNLWIIEDDVHAFLPREALAPVATFAKERTVYLSSLAKCVAPGLRTGYLLAPAPLRPRLLTAVHTSMWMPPPLMVEVATRWLADGTAERVIAKKRDETEERQRLARRMLAGYTLHAHPSGYQIWLELPEPWCGDEFVTQTRERGLIVIGAGAFAVGRRGVPHAVRLSIGRPSRLSLERGLAAIAELLAGGATAAY